MMPPRRKGGLRWGRRTDERLGEVVLRDVEKAARDGLEGPELGEPKALEVDDDERLAYRPSDSGRRGWEDLGEEGLDVDEDSAPVFLRGHLLVEPLGAYRAEALDMYGAAELYTDEKVRRGHRRRRMRAGLYLIGLEDRARSGADHGKRVGIPGG